SAPDDLRAIARDYVRDPYLVVALACVTYEPIEDSFVRLGPPEPRGDHRHEDQVFRVCTLDLMHHFILHPRSVRLWLHQGVRVDVPGRRFAVGIKVELGLGAYHRDSIV